MVDNSFESAIGNGLLPGCNPVHGGNQVLIRRTILIVGSLLLLSLTMGADQAPPKVPTISWSKDLATAHGEMTKTKRPLLMFFTTPGCNFCKKMKSETFRDSAVAKDVTQNYVAVIVDGRQYPRVAKQLKLRIYPATAIVHPDGQVVELVHGYKPAPVFREAPSGGEDEAEAK